MDIKNVRRTFCAAIAASPLAFMGAAHAEPFIKYTHPKGTPMVNGGYSQTDVTRNVDCGKLYRPPSKPNSIHLTRSFFASMDIEGAQIGADADLQKSEAENIEALRPNNIFFLQHSAIGHASCRSQYYNLGKITGQKIPYDAKPEWGQMGKDKCPLQEVVQQCAQQLGIK